VNQGNPGSFKQAFGEQKIMAGPNLSDANSGVLTIGFREFNLTRVAFVSVV